MMMLGDFQYEWRLGLEQIPDSYALAHMSGSA